ncbi:nitrogen fixation protein NifX [cf. Phormidesmis sp. LEGE 11477]|uniref:nitrogen fixation protein NifX n=1 Tax=cf. Phormidesmis sp. LEGE 11477 TaxID=1828680 RepID=UPI0018823FD1|nr:nitrogen fixation protein NifX [cf. Phormidesmis sp. LEGE 11477]MBE9059818.1 nitrogen fixation protein NifX [cf. Phormidesmis sp. LEGE 11477]
MKVAFATSDSVHIDAHFGSAKQIDVYEINTEGSSFVEALTFGGNLDQDGNEDKLAPKLKALAGCTIVYVATIGGGAAARLIGRNIVPIKPQTENADIQELLVRLVQTLQGSPPPWLRKALLKGQPDKTLAKDKFEDTINTVVEEIVV